MHEIVTLQFGQQANHVGTHFWNTQESYFTYGAEEESPVNHDVHFRPGVATDGSDTFMPRAVVYDLKGAFGNLRKINALYEAEGEPEGLWTGPTVPIKQTPIEPSPYQQHLDAGLQPPPLSTSTVRYWSDYSRVYYHPRSLVQLQEYELNARLMPFERWDAGEELFGDLDREYDLLDRDLRPFIEECDQLQGLQIMSSVDDAWGGFCGKYLERLRDEFGKLSLWVWALENEEGKTRDRRHLHLTNTTLSLTALSPNASAYIPISNNPLPTPPYLTLDPTSRWHTSALQAAAIETMTLPSRLRTTDPASQSLANLEATFNGNGGRRIARMGVSVAEPGALLERLERRTERRDERAAARTRTRGGRDEDEDALGKGAAAEDLDMGLWAAVAEEGGAVKGRGPQATAPKEHVFGCAESLRGAWEVPGTVEEGNAEARERRFGGGTVVQRYHTPLLFPLLDSYPHIFDFPANANSANTDPEDEGSGKALAVQTSLSTTSAIATRLRYLGGFVPRLVGIEDREALGNGLVTLAEEYEEGWEGAEDSDEGE